MDSPVPDETGAEKPKLTPREAEGVFRRIVDPLYPQGRLGAVEQGLSALRHIETAIDMPPELLDAMLGGIRHARLQRWFGFGQVAFPVRAAAAVLIVCAAVTTASLRVEDGGGTRQLSHTAVLTAGHRSEVPTLPTTTTPTTQAPTPTSTPTTTQVPATKVAAVPSESKVSSPPTTIAPASGPRQAETPPVTLPVYQPPSTTIPTPPTIPNPVSPANPIASAPSQNPVSSTCDTTISSSQSSCPSGVVQSSPIVSGGVSAPTNSKGGS